MIGNNAVCYQGLQRVFRNAIVEFLREHLPRVYPKDHVHQLKRPFGAAWESAAANASLSRNIGGTATVIKDDYDLLGVNHFHEVFEKHFDKLFSISGGYPPSRPRPVKSKLLGNFKAIKDGRDPLSHPVDEEVSYDEAFGLLIDAKQILAALGINEAAQSLAELADQLDSGQSEPSFALRHLPTQDSIYLEFVGRAGLLEQLDTCFREADNRRCLLAGDGGKGKSAAAYRFAQILAQNPGRFKLVVWLSAKRRRFEEGKVVRIDSPDFTSTDDAVDRLLLEYDALQEDFKKPLAAKKELLLQYLDAYPAFIVADDIDTLLDDFDVVSLFSHEIPHTQSAVLLTSRRDIPGIRSFVVKGFEPKEAEEFVYSRRELYGLDASVFTPAIVKEIVRVTDASPLYMDDLMRLGRVIDIKKAITTWAEKRGDEARKYALQREMEKLSEDARKTLVAAAIPDGSVSFAELENVLAFSEDRLVAALSELQTLFLFPKPKVVEGEQRFEINLNTKKLVRLVESSSSFFARIEHASKALRGQLPDVGPGIIGALIRQAQLRLNAGRNQEAEAILLNAVEKYPQVGDLHSFLGYAYKRMDRIVDARTQFAAALKLRCKRKDMFLQWLWMEMAEKEWSKAVSVADNALKAIPDFYEMVAQKVYAKRQAGFDFYRGTHSEKADRMWRDAVEDVKLGIKPPEALETGQRQINASLLCSMVICLDMLSEFRERDRWLERWEGEHPDDPQLGRQRSILLQKRGGVR